MSLRCSSLSDAKNRATAVSEGALGVGPTGDAGPSALAQAGRISGDEAATAAVPTVLTNSRRENPEPGRWLASAIGEPPWTVWRWEGCSANLRRTTESQPKPAPRPSQTD